MVLVGGGGVYTQRHVADAIVAAPAAALPRPGSGGSSSSSGRRGRRRSSNDPTAWAGMVREHDDLWWKQHIVGADASKAAASLRQSNRRGNLLRPPQQNASFFEADVVDGFRRKTTRSVSPFSHAPEWKQHRAQSLEVQLVRRQMSPGREAERAQHQNQRAASAGGGLYDRGVVAPFLKQRKKPVLPKLLAPEPEPEPEPLAVPVSSLVPVARHGSYIRELQNPAAPPPVVQAAYVPTEEVSAEKAARYQLEKLLRVLFRMCDIKGTGTVATCIKIDEFCIKNDEFVLKVMNLMQTSRLPRQICKIWTG